ncbi:glutamate--tRNA ligase family protein [Pontibacter sp. G13]|uniref:glutamate--tRNA ligase family protein n=1 Tax=Pontibacter sp. G13 TaxID=3074898 RepID=UPI002889494B|nr:glutamate--tRNA ligase family protein [Pontibacter sp. G13]WNJ17673.1 glutamate--tRNA ligase family protein [Pontibacter sp. G13]
MNKSKIDIRLESPHVRLAPTPSGFLHEGNLFNFLLNWLWARAHGGTVRLRIDDLDRTRVRPKYIEDIFRTLELVGIDWDQGPTGPDDHARDFSQMHAIPAYLAAIEQLKAKTDRVFACVCSRKQIMAASQDGQYPGTCRTSGHTYQTGETSLRIQTPSTTPILWQDHGLGQISVDLGHVMRDFVIRRKDGIPAYQIASLIDDLNHGVNTWIRGEDLLASSAAQMWLASLLGKKEVTSWTVWHHPLLTAQAGEKLSKSAGSEAISPRLIGQNRGNVYRNFAKWMNWPSEEITGLEDLRELSILQWITPSEKKF